MRSLPGPAPLKLIISAVLLVAFSIVLLQQVWRSLEPAGQTDDETRVAQAHMQLSRMLVKVARWVTLEPRALPLTQENLEAALSDGTQRPVLDPWDNPIRIEVIEPQPGWFRLTSVGPDGEFGTADDISVHTAQE